jgi:hypothetical protein
MKRLLLLVTVSMLLAMWILTAWEVAQAASSTPVSIGPISVSTVPTPMPTTRSSAIRFVNSDGKHRIPDHNFRRHGSQPVIDWDRFEADRHEQPAAGAPIFFDPIEQRRLIR